jgi:hypothetical protein
MPEDTVPPGSWLPKRWLVGAVLVLGALGGLGIAQSSDGATGYAGGLVLFATTTIGVFVLISTSYGPSPLMRVQWFPRNGALCWALGGAVGVAAITGLFHARAAEPGGFAYYNGLGLFLTAAAYDFVLLKDWFDRQSGGRS